MRDLEATSQTQTVGFLLAPGFALMSYAAAVEPLRAANMIAGRTLYQWFNISTECDAVSSAGLIAPSDYFLNEKLPPQGVFDYIFVCAGGRPEEFTDNRVFNWLRKLDREGSTIGAISGGSLILAAAGVVTGRRVTVHWEHAEFLQEHYPDVVLDRALYVIDRDRVTCAGGLAPMDMMHALIQERHGAAFAQKVSDWFLHTQVRPSESAQRSNIVEEYGIANKHLVAAIEFMRNRLATPPRLEELGRYVGLSSRQLERLFQDHLGESVMTTNRKIRLEAAKRLLMSTPISITEIAYATGFSHGAHFSACFYKYEGMSPRQFRDSRRHKR